MQLSPDLLAMAYITNSVSSYLGHAVVMLWGL
jgi:hypothetical protein